jgi:hypothetical protein
MSEEINKNEQLKKTTAAQNKFLTALAENLGNITKTCLEINISRASFYKWKNNEESQFSQKLVEIEEQVFDWVEEKIFERLQEKSDTMLIFYAKTRMKKRGYIERTELTGADGNEIKIYSGFDPEKV